MRVIIAGVLGGIALFFWGFVSHMLLPIGEMGMKAPGNEDVVISALKEGLPSEGVYMLPYLASEDMDNTAKTTAYSEKARTSPYAFVIYQPQGADSMDMGDELGKQFISDTLSALMVAWILSLSAFSFGRRIAIATVIGITAWMIVSVPYWNWYRFPLDFTLGSLAEHSIGFLIASLPMAWWLGRKGG